MAYTSSAITLTDAAGRVVTASLNSAGLLTKLALPDKRNVIYKYTNGMLTSAQDAASDTWLFGYTSGLLTTVVDPQGRTQLTSTYTGGRVTRQVDASAAATTFGWDASNQVSTTTDADGVKFYDGYRGNVLDALGHTTQYGYTSTDQIASIVSPAGEGTTMPYDSRGLATTMTDPRGKVTTMAYDAAGNLISKTSAMGEVTTYTYDSSGRLLTKVDPRGDVAGARALDFTTINTYDNLDRVTGLLAPRKAHPSTTAYDSVGQATATADPLGHTTRYTYGSVIGRTATITDVLGGVITYDADGRSIATIAPTGRGLATEYDAAGNMTKSTSPTGGITIYSYNADGRIASTVDPRGNDDPFGNPRSDGTAAGTTNSVSTPIRFAGGYQDSTLGGQYSTVNRLYDPATGRFNRVDPVAQPAPPACHQPVRVRGRPAHRQPRPERRLPVL